MTTMFLVSVAFTTFALIDRSRSYCRAQNTSINATEEVLRVSLEGPHRFNSPQDVLNRYEVYEKQIEKLEGAKCQ